MEQIEKKTVLLLGHNVWQERTLALVLKLGGYVVRVVKDADEAINLVKNVPDIIHGIILPGSGCQSTLRSRLDAFSRNAVSTHIYLVGAGSHDPSSSTFQGDVDGRLKVSFCSSEQLLAQMNQ